MNKLFSKFPAVIAFILLVLLFFNAFQLLNENETLLNLYDKCKHESSNKNYFLQKLLTGYKKQFKYENRLIDSVFVENTFDIQANGILCLYFNERSCSYCVENCLEQLVKIKKDYTDLNIIIINGITKSGSYHKSRERFYGKYFSFVYIQSEHTNLEDKNSVFFFYINQQRHIKKYFLVIKGFEFLTKKYLNSVILELNLK